MEEYIVRDIIHYCNITTRKCTRIDEHIIDYYDLTFVLEGSMTYYANGTKHVMHKNDAIFLKPGTRRERESGTETVHYVSFNFLPFDGISLPFDDFLPKCITANMRNLVSIYPTSHISPDYHFGKQGSAERFSMDHSALDKYSRQKCTCMLNYLLYDLLDSITLRCSNEHINKILKYIDDNIYDKLTLKEISDYVNLSKEYTCAIFKREMNQTLTEYINERKLLLARELILSREMPLSDVASQMGFDNYNYFCRLFKAYYGMTPMFLKKELNMQKENDYRSFNNRTTMS